MFVKNDFNSGEVVVVIGLVMFPNEGINVEELSEQKGAVEDVSLSCKDC